MKWFKDHISTIFFSMVMLLGICLLAYPAASDWWNSYHQSKVLAGYVNVIQEMPEKDYSEFLDAARAYNARLAGLETQSFQSDESAYQEYMSLLNPAGTGMMARIKIKKIDVDLPVYHGTDDNVLQVAVGHLFGSSLPVGGESTHACLSGHTGLPRAMLFTDLTELTMGDIFTIQIFNELLTYEVDKIDIVEPQDVSSLQIETGRDYMTLITCTPYGVNSHRLLVRGHRIENLPEDELALQDGLSSIKTGPKFRFDLNTLGLVLLVIILLGLWLLFWLGKRRGQRDAAANAKVDPEALHTDGGGPDSCEVAGGVAVGSSGDAGEPGAAAPVSTRAQSDVKPGGEPVETAPHPLCEAHPGSQPVSYSALTKARLDALHSAGLRDGSPGAPELPQDGRGAVQDTGDSLQ